MDIYLEPKNLKELDQWLPLKQEDQAKCNVFLDLPMSALDLKKLKKLNKVFKPYQDLNKIVFNFKPVDYNIPKQQLADALDFQVDKKMDIKFYDGYHGFFSIDVVYLAMEKIYKYSDFIIENKLSPLEAMLYAYFVATQKPYKEEKKKGGDTRDSRSIYAVMLNDRIVCEGYCNVIKAIVSNLNNPNIALFDNSTVDFQDNKKTLHATLVAYIKDEKYNIDGYYFLDPTKDAEVKLCQDVKDRGFFMNNFMIPLGDFKYANNEFREVKLNHFYAYDSNEKVYETDKKSMYDSTLKFSQDSLIINEQFEKALQSNEKIMNDLLKNYNIDLNKVKFEKLHKNPKLLEDALIKNSEPIMLGTLINATYKVFDAMKIYPTKELNFKFTKGIINNNILVNEIDFKKGAQNEISVCEEGYKM